MPDEPKEEKKIYVDEDWKARAQAEKEELKGQQQEKPQEQADSAENAEALPPATLPWLITSMAAEAMMAMGLVADPATGEAKLRVSHTRHLIDLIQMLHEKTEGNRTSEESTLLDNMLHQLRMAFISVQQQGEGKGQ